MAIPMWEEEPHRLRPAVIRTAPRRLRIAKSDPVRIGIVGSGPAGCAALEDLLKKFRQRLPLLPTEISVVDLCGRFAGGDAFGATTPTARLNTDYTKMGPLEQPGAVAHQRGDEPAKPGDPIERGRYGEYLRAHMDTVIRDLSNLGVQFRFLAEEITAIEPQAGGTAGYVLESRQGRRHFDVLVMATGRVSSSGPAELAGLASVIENPWAPGALDAIPRDHRVVGLGTSLTAVDIVRRLHANGHRGLITLVARTRGLPTVQNLGDHPYRPSVLTHAAVEAITAYGTRELTWTEVLDLLYGELKEAGVAETNEGVDEEIRKQVDLARCNPHAFLLKNIAEAQAGRAVMSAVIGALNDATRFAWPFIADEDAFRLLHYKSLYSMFANSMPLANAQMMERVMSQGLLRVHVGLTAVTHNAAADHYIATTTHPHGYTVRHVADTVIVATGNTRRLADAGPLIRQMLADGIIREHPRGGVDITPAGRVIRADGTPASGLWWIGEATEGPRLGTNCVRVIKHHSRATVEDLASVIYAPGGASGPR